MKEVRSCGSKDSGRLEFHPPLRLDDTHGEHHLPKRFVLLVSRMVIIKHSVALVLAARGIRWTDPHIKICIT